MAIKQGFGTRVRLDLASGDYIVEVDPAVVMEASRAAEFMPRNRSYAAGPFLDGGGDGTVDRAFSARVGYDANSVLRGDNDARYVKRDAPVFDVPPVAPPPTAAGHLATRGWVESFAQGIKLIGSARVATTGPVTLSGLQTIDNVALAESDRVLVVSHADAKMNGYYVASAGAWTRAPEMDAADECATGVSVRVREGSTGRGTWTLTTQSPVLGLSALRFEKLSDADQLVAGAGFTKTGLQFDLATDDPALEVYATGVRLKTISDAQHGTRAGGNTHPLAVPSVGGIGGTAGYISPTQAEKVNSAAMGATRTPLGTALPLKPGATASAGTSANAAREDHQHELPPLASTTVSGLMASTDKAKLDALQAAAVLGAPMEFGGILPVSTTPYTAGAAPTIVGYLRLSTADSAPTTPVRRGIFNQRRVRRMRIVVLKNNLQQPVSVDLLRGGSPFGALEGTGIGDTIPVGFTGVLPQNPDLVEYTIPDDSTLDVQVTGWGSGPNGTASELVVQVVIELLPVPGADA